jgi:glucosamine kinase
VTAPLVLAADVGRTTCRVALGDGRPLRVAGGASLADRDGPAVVVDALHAAADRLGVATPARGVTHVSIGVTGAAQSPAGAAELAGALHTRYPTARVLVTSDVVTAHVGALAGAPGIVTVGGTGAVALGVGEDGAHVLVDGYGPVLGDAGSGTWIGRRALDAALRHHDGRPGGSPALAAAATERYGPLPRLAGAIQGASAPWRDVAAFVPDVAAAARGGDPVARRLFTAAVAELAATTRAAARHLTSRSDRTRPRARSFRASLVGGLADLITLVRDPLAEALELDDAAPSGAADDPEVRLVPAVADALAGARRLAVEGPGVHDQLVLQLPPGHREVADRWGPGAGDAHRDDAVVAAPTERRT